MPEVRPDLYHERLKLTTHRAIKGNYNVTRGQLIASIERGSLDIDIERETNS